MTEKRNRSVFYAAQCLQSTSLKPSKLKRHLETHHPDSSNKDLNFFKRKAETLIKSRLDQSGMFWKDTKSGLKASYEVSRKIAASKKPTTLEKS